VQNAMADVIIVSTAITDSCSTSSVSCPAGYVVTGAWVSGGGPGSCAGEENVIAITALPSTNPTYIRVSSGSQVVKAACAKICQ
jgi:hypothetical protein